MRGLVARRARRRALAALAALAARPARRSTVADVSRTGEVAETRPRRQMWTLRCNPAADRREPGVRAASSPPAATTLFAPRPRRRSRAPRSTAARRRARVAGVVAGRACGRRFDATTAARSTAGSAVSSALASGAAVGRSAAPQLASAAVKTVLFVGAGRHQRRAIVQARGRGLRVVGGRPQRRGARDLRSPTSLRRSTSPTSTRSPKSRGRIGVDGALTVSADRAVPVVAAVAERLGLPGIGTRRRPPDDAQDRDAEHARRGRRAATAVSPPFAR